VACEEIQPELDNPYDPENPNYISPEFYFINDFQSGDTLDNFEQSIAWSGNEFATEFRYKYNQEPWSDWGTVLSLELTFLDEGDYQLLGQARSLSGEETPVDTLKFVIDAVQGPALMFFPRRHIALQGDTVTFHIIAEEVENLAGAEINLNISSIESQLEVISITEGTMFSDIGESIFIYEENGQNGYMENINNNTGDISIWTATLGGSQTAVSGSGTLVEITVAITGFSWGVNYIEFSGEEILRDPDNNSIIINETVNGRVNQ
jgi:hypothetical protein